MKNDNTWISVIFGVVLGFALACIGCLIFGPETSASEIYTAAYARTILRASARLEPEKQEYDIDGNGKITAADARIVLRRAALLPDYPETTTTTIVTTTQTPTTETIIESQYYQLGVLSTCGLTETQLYNGLKYNLKPYAWAFLEAEKQYNVNAVFLAAVAALESGWGRSNVAINRNNFFGWTGRNGYMYFDTPAEGIMHVAKKLRENYLTRGGSCFVGYEVEDVAVYYCPGGVWAAQIYQLMRIIENGAN